MRPHPHDWTAPTPAEAAADDAIDRAQAPRRPTRPVPPPGFLGAALVVAVNRAMAHSRDRWATGAAHWTPPTTTTKEQHP